MPPVNAPIPQSQTVPDFGILTFPGDLLSHNSSSTTTIGGSTIATASASGATATSNGSPTPYTESTGGYYSQFQFVKASSVIGIGTPGGTGGTVGFPIFNTDNNIYLPLPLKINDVNLALWQDASVLDFIPVLGTKLAGTAAGTRSQAVNPFLYMLYKQPFFREFIFQWILAPNSPDESTKLLEILYAFKTAILPEYNYSGYALDYPYLVYARLNPNKFMFDIKPCCIISCEIDFSGSGHTPSFFNSGAPTIVSFTVHLKEVQILTRTDVAPRGGMFSSMMTGSGGLSG